MKNIALTVLLVFLSLNAFSQIKYAEEKNLEMSKILAKVHTGSAYGFKNYLVKTFIINPTFGYSKNENPEGAQQNAYISISFFGKEITTKLFKVDALINVEIVNVSEAPTGLEITVNHGVKEDRIEESFILEFSKK